MPHLRPRSNIYFDLLAPIASQYGPSVRDYTAEDIRIFARQEDRSHNFYRYLRYSCSEWRTYHFEQFLPRHFRGLVCPPLTDYVLLHDRLAQNAVLQGMIIADREERRIPLAYIEFHPAEADIPGGPFAQYARIRSSNLLNSDKELAERERRSREFAERTRQAMEEIERKRREKERQEQVFEEMNEAIRARAYERQARQDRRWTILVSSGLGLLLLMLVAYGADFHLYVFDRPQYLINRAAKLCTDAEFVLQSYHRCMRGRDSDERCRDFYARYLELKGECQAADMALSAEVYRGTTQ